MEVKNGIIYGGIMMHQCDYCCWYNERCGNCECPYVMRKEACDKAKKEKERSEK